jgi:hypothetical protein
VSGEVVVEFESGAISEDGTVLVDLPIELTDVDILSTDDQGNVWATASIPDGMSVKTVLAKLVGADGIVIAEPNYLYSEQ